MGQFWTKNWTAILELRKRFFASIGLILAWFLQKFVFNRLQRLGGRPCGAACGISAHCCCQLQPWFEFEIEEFTWFSQKKKIRFWTDFGVLNTNFEKIELRNFVQFFFQLIRLIEGLDCDSDVACLFVRRIDRYCLDCTSIYTKNL